MLGVVWNAAGVQLYGGEGDTRTTRDLVRAAYVDAHYDVNFNDYANGYVPLFAMIATGGPFTEFIELSYAVTVFRPWVYLLRVLLRRRVSRGRERLLGLCY